MTSPFAQFVAETASAMLAVAGHLVETTGISAAAGVRGLVDEEEILVDDGQGLQVPTVETVLSVLPGSIGAPKSEHLVTVGGRPYRIRGRVEGRGYGAFGPLERWRIAPATSSGTVRGTR